MSLVFYFEASKLRIRDSQHMNINLVKLQNIYLGGEVLSSAGGLVLRVGGDISSLDVLNGDILDVESDVVAGNGLGQRFVVHLDGLDLSGQLVRSEGDDHA